MTGLLLPVALNAAIGTLCVVLFGSALGWTAENRAEYGPWIGNGLPFLQFMAVAFLVNQLFRTIIARLTVSLPPHRVIPKLALQLISTLIYGAFLGSSVSVVFDESVGAVLAASGIAGLAVGFAIRGLLSDIFSGIALHLDTSINAGDWMDVSVRSNHFSGRLIDIQWRTVVIADRSENLVFIPNSEFATAIVVNRSHPTKASEYGASLPVSIEYDRARVAELLENVLSRAVGDGTLLDQPKPYVRVGDIEAGSVLYKMFYCIDLNRMSPPRAQSAVLSLAIDFLKAAGIRLRPIHQTEYSRPGAPGRDRLTELEPRLRVLADVPLLAVLSQDELTELARHSAVNVFSAGEQVMRAGEDGDSMVVVLEGRLDVLVEDRLVATLWPGECAGEMSLLTGSPRSATVTAAIATNLLEVPKSALTPILQSNPLLVERIAVAINKRKGAGKSSERQDDKPGDQRETSGLVSMIRMFFRV